VQLVQAELVRTRVAATKVRVAVNQVLEQSLLVVAVAVVAMCLQPPESIAPQANLQMAGMEQQLDRAAAQVIIGKHSEGVRQVSLRRRLVTPERYM
jgi:hypothetical protein